MKRFILIFILIVLTINLEAFKKHTPEEILTSTADALSVCKPLRYKNLTIFPLALSKGRDTKSIITLDEAINRNYINIKETESGDVNTVVLINTSKYYVFLLSGEIITGCKQDRMVGEDCLIPPHSGKVYLHVYCTEHGRWTKKSERFSGGLMAISPNMRKVAKTSESQSEVWDQVEEKREEIGATASPTSRYMDIVQDKKIAGKLNSYIDKFSNIPDIKNRNVVGAVAAVGDEIIVLDIFTNHRLFKKLWSKLIKSYALDAIHKTVYGKLSRRDVYNFIKNLNDAELTERKTDGVGKSFTINNENSFGTSLIFKNKITHLDLFPEVTSHPKGRIPILDFRRKTQ